MTVLKKSILLSLTLIVFAGLILQKQQPRSPYTKSTNLTDLTDLLKESKHFKKVYLSKKPHKSSKDGDKEKNGKDLWTE